MHFDSILPIGAVSITTTITESSEKKSGQVKICCWLHYCTSSRPLIQQNGLMGEQGHKLWIQDQTHQCSFTQPCCWPYTYSFLVSLWTQGNQFTVCIACGMLVPGRAHICSDISRQTIRNARVSTILTLDLWSPGCQKIPFENVHMGIRVKNFCHGNTLQETEMYDFFPWYWRNTDRYDGEEESRYSDTFDPLSTREIYKSYYPSAPGYSSPTALYHFQTLLPALLPLQVTLPLQTISWLEIGVTESESSPRTPGLPLLAAFFHWKNWSFSSKS